MNIKALWVAIVAVLLTSSASAIPAARTTKTQVGHTTEIDFDTSTGESSAFPAGSTCEVFFDYGGAGTVQLHEVPQRSDAAAAGNQLGSDYTADTTADTPNTHQPRYQWLIAKATVASDGSEMTVRCTNEIATSDTLEPSSANSSCPFKQCEFADGYLYVNKFGSNAAIGGSGSTYEPVWSASTTPYPWPTSADTVTVVSSSANDDDTTGSHAWKVQVEGLDGSWDLASEEITMDGATPVTGAQQFIRVFRVYVTESGAYGNANAGTIDIDHTTSGDLLAEIEPGIGQTEMALYTCPDTYACFVMDSIFKVGALSNQEADFRIVTRADADNTGSTFRPFRVRHSIIGVDQADETTWTFRSGLRVEARTDIMAEATETAAGSDAQGDAEFGIALIPLTELP